MNNLNIVAYPYIYLAFISLHLLSGQGLTGFFYWLRFGKSPVIYHQTKNQNKHNLISRWLALPVIFWFISLCFYAFSTSFRQSSLGFNFFNLNPLYGWGIALTGLFGMLVCQYQMGEAFRVGQEPEQQSSQNNLYRGRCFKYSRNPIYFFSMLYLIGVSLWVLIWPVWFALLMIIALIHFLVMEEELFLTQRFGQEYLQYKKQVPRYFIW